MDLPPDLVGEETGYFPTNLQDASPLGRDHGCLEPGGQGCFGEVPQSGRALEPLASNSWSWGGTEIPALGLDGTKLEALPHRPGFWKCPFPSDPRTSLGSQKGAATKGETGFLIFVVREGSNPDSVMTKESNGM